MNFTTDNLTSILGMFLLCGIAWIFSTNRRRMNWRLIGMGLAIQAAMALFIFKVPAGARLFLWANDVVVKILGAAFQGTYFVFGRLAVMPGTTGPYGEESIGFILAVQSLAAIIFFAALMSVLYYYGVMQRIIKGFSWVFTRLMRVSGAESLCASSNIFVGIESSLTIRPYLADMTRSELCTVLTAGMATVASTIMAAYVGMLRGQFPNIAAHLMSASLLSAPAAIVMSKILMPEEEKPKTLGLCVDPYCEKENSLFEAIINGANAGVKLVVGVVALLLAVLGMVGLLNMALGWAGGHMNARFGWEFNWTLENALGYVFYPFAAIMGVPAGDTMTVSRLIGERVIVTELTAYQHLGAVMGQMNPRSVVLTTYALCGFAHVASLAIFVGGTAALAPSRARDLSAVGVRALVAATFACFLTACMAGAIPMENTLLLGSIGK